MPQPSAPTRPSALSARPHPPAGRAKLALPVLVGVAVGIALSGMGCSDAPDVDLPAAQANEASKPEPLSWSSRVGLGAFLDLAAWAEFESGYVAMFARDGHVVHAHTAGYADLESEIPMQLESRFRLASMTKPVTAVAAMILIEEERLSLDDEVRQFIPAADRLRVATTTEFGDGEAPATTELERPLQVRDLLQFRAGIGSEDTSTALGQLWAERDIYAGSGSLSERVDRILTAPLFEQPGVRWRYGWTADVLARVVEVAAGQPFDLFLQRRIFEPLEMSSTGFLRPESWSAEERSRLVTMYTQDEDGELTRVETPASDAPDWTPGGSGLVSTAGDYMRFALMLWNRGSYDGVRILAPETVDLMTRAHVTGGVLENEGIDGLGWGLGLAVVVDSDATPTTDRDGDFWWSGYYGTSFFVSPESGLVGVVLSQNQPSEHSGWPIVVYVAQSFAFFGL